MRRRASRRALLLTRRHRVLPSGLLRLGDTADGPSGVHLVQQLWHPGETFVFVEPHDIRIGRDTHLLVPGSSCYDIQPAGGSKAFAEKSPASTLAIHRET